MKKRILPVCVLVIAAHTILPAQDKVLSSVIREVTVFYQGAQVTRASEDVTLTTGQHLLTLEGLERSLQVNSLRVGITGTAKILNVVKSTDYINQQESSVKITQLQEELDKNRRKTEDLNVEIQVYEQEKALLAANMKLGGSDNGVAVSQIREGAVFYRSRLLEIEKQILLKRREIKNVQEQNNKIQAQLNELNYQRNQPTSKVEVTVEMEKAGSCRIFLDYIVPQAGWAANYDIRIDEVGGPVNVIRKASVSQQTGQDWEDVKLRFSTGNPMEQQTVPELQPWFVQFVYPQNREIKPSGMTRSRSKSVVDKSEAAASETMALSEVVEVGYDGFVAVETGRNNSILEFEVQTKATIRSDGKDNAFSLGSEELDASYHFQSVPKKEKAAYLMATMTDWEGYELVDGTANIYYEKMFIGETYLTTNMTLDSLRLSLGEDKGIIVDRKVVKDFTRARTIGNSVRKTFGFEIVVRNTKSSIAELVVEDQIPLSSDSQITVDMEEIGEGELDEQTGKVTWRLNIDPGETVTLPFKYSIKYPKDKVIGI